MKSLLSICCILLSSALAWADSTEQQVQFFENQIRPLLVEHCYDCHSAESGESEGGLRLDSMAGWKKGGDSGPTIVPGDAAKSLLIEAISYENVDLQMPPDGKLPADQIALLHKWIQSGAHDPRISEANEADAENEFDLDKRRDEHWCWQPIAQVDPPNLKSDWPTKEIDAFILARLQQNNLSPASPADKRTLLRRMSFATIGLPPTTDEIESYLKDDSDEATEKVLDRLLNSPHFGENWAQHWLDLMRFAETRGHEQDYAIPHAFRYRDYVIQAYNEDVPYDQFVTEHIAGDLLEQPRLHPADRTNQSTQGTGFWQLHDATHSPVDICGEEVLRIQNQIDVFSRSFLGLSLGCARCHDHKFDAISTRDYYSMYGYLQSSSYHLADISDPEQQATVAAQLAERSKEQTLAVRKLLANKLQEQAKTMPEYLSAAIDFDPAVAKSETLPDAVQKVADSLSLNADRLWNLTKYLHSKLDVDSPLKYWSLLAAARDQSPSDIAGQLETLRNNVISKNAKAWKTFEVIRSVKDGERNYKPTTRTWKDSDIIADFHSANFPHWITSGHRFGSSPVAAGSMILRGDSDRPAWFADGSIASSETLSGKLTGLLRTRTFEITGDKIWYRYRGNGKVFLAVDSHRVVAGPLHGVVKKDLKSEDHQWHWFSQNVRDYVGHRVHVEFTGGPDFAVDQVLFASEQPPTTQLLPEIVSTDAFVSLADRLRQNEVSAHDASLLNWWLDNQSLMPPASNDAIESIVAKYIEQKTEIEAKIPQPQLALSLLDGSGENEHVHIRGSHRNRSKETVPRGSLTAFGKLDTSNIPGSGRLDLAKKLTDPSNPLLARVYVNRIWHHLFGRGIVESVDDFGVMGKEPTHPELLDYLARQFMDNGWSTKRLIRELMLSSTYQMSSKPDLKNENLDPTNRFLHRMPIRRLTGEVIRDNLLAVSGRLDRKQFGQSIKVHITSFMRGNRTPSGSGPVDGDGRRSIYTEVRRNHLPAFLAAFDKPPPFMAIGRRTVSNSPTQSLILLNDPLVHDQAMLWAKRLLQQDQSDEQRIAKAFEQAFARIPDPTEISAAMQFVEQQIAAYSQDSETQPTEATENAWRDLCHTLVNVKEFIHVN